MNKDQKVRFISSNGTTIKARLYNIRVVGQKIYLDNVEKIKEIKDFISINKKITMVVDNSRIVNFEPSKLFSSSSHLVIRVKGRD